jgi:hypothetical protein
MRAAAKEFETFEKSRVCKFLEHSRPPQLALAHGLAYLSAWKTVVSFVSTLSYAARVIDTVASIRRDESTRVIVSCSWRISACNFSNAVCFFRPGGGTPLEAATMNAIHSAGVNAEAGRRCDRPRKI